ncbi:MAG: N-acetyl-gamma-glutamyl-phosphate reductase [Bacteroidetes bacterium]|nr:MAG: N-acetyl-gamma-glutamyl-phosphate reductase [Bacteroidota bacterium]
MNKIKIGIAGGAGYTGGELIRILINHPAAEIVFAHSKSNAGKYIHEVHADLLGESDLTFNGDILDKDWKDIELLFLCVGHGEAKKFLEQNEIPQTVRIIDLSQDFRLIENANYDRRPFVYGLPELNRDQIRTARNVANPGCFATAIQLGLLPLAKAGLLEEVYTTGITGSTGAGQSLSPAAHFSWRANNIQAYKTLNHQHVKEIQQSLLQLQPGLAKAEEADRGLSFVPWRGDFTRGIFISSLMNSNTKVEALAELYEDFYEDHPFTFLSKDAIFLKQVVNTNKCLIQLEKIGSKLVVHSIIDNLVKGASGQAVQNMNLMFGLDECAGLRLKANYF